MPYIKQEDRQKYAEPIVDVIEMLKLESSMSLGLHYGHFVYCLVRRAFGGGSGWMPLHDSPFHSESLKNILNVGKYTVVFHALLPTDLDQRMGELNYVLSTIAWRLTEKANYATRSYVKGALLTVMNEIPVIGENAYHGVIVRGVLSDVVDEMYRRRTAIYEDSKKDENGDILSLVYTREKLIGDRIDQAVVVQRTRDRIAELSQQVADIQSDLSALQHHMENGATPAMGESQFSLSDFDHYCPGEPLSDFDHYCPGEPLSEFEVSPDVNVSSPAPPPPRGE